MKEVIGIELMTSENPEEAAETAVEQGELALRVTKKKQYDDDEIKEAADTLIRAEEIRAEPDLLAAAQEALKKKKEALGKIRGIGDIKKASKMADKKARDAMVAEETAEGETDDGSDEADEGE